MDYLWLGLDLQSVDIGCDGSTGDAQQQVSQFSDFPSLVERLKQANDWKATESFSCFKERKFAKSGDNHELEMYLNGRAYDCRNKCTDEYELICQSKFLLI